MMRRQPCWIIPSGLLCGLPEAHLGKAHILGCLVFSIFTSPNVSHLAAEALIPRLGGCFWNFLESSNLDLSSLILPTQLDIAVPP